MAVVDSVPAAHHGVRTVAPVKLPTQSRKVVSKGKAVSHPTTRLRARKVTQIATPMLEVADVAAPPLPPVAGPSRASRAPLFEVADGSGNEQVEKGAPASSGKRSLGLPWWFTDCGHPSFLYAHLVEA